MGIRLCKLRDRSGSSWQWEDSCSPTSDYSRALDSYSRALEGMSDVDPFSMRTFQVSDLKIGKNGFDPVEPSMRALLLEHLKLGTGSTIKALGGSRGGQNAGLWSIRDSAPRTPTHMKDLVIKLVKLGSQESEKFRALALRHPHIVKDPDLAFPIQIVRLLGMQGQKMHELIVMPKAPGVPLQDFIGEKWWSTSRSSHTQLMQVIEKVGGSVAEFHARYGNSQHCDLQVSNIFYDAETSQVTIIDLAHVGRKAKDNDVEHFCECLQLFSGAYGSAFVQTVKHFRKGYSSRCQLL